MEAWVSHAMEPIPIVRISSPRRARRSAHLASSRRGDDATPPAPVLFRSDMLLRDPLVPLSRVLAPLWADRHRVGPCCFCLVFERAVLLASTAAGPVPTRPSPRSRKPPSCTFGRAGQGGQGIAEVIIVSQARRGAGGTFCGRNCPHDWRFRRPPKARMAASGMARPRTAVTATRTGSSA